MGRLPVIPAELATGPFTIDDARRAGLTPRQLQGSSWRRLGSGLYCWAGWTPTPLPILKAIARRLPKRAAFSGPTAAWLHGLDLPPCDPVVVTLPDRRGASRLAGMSVQRARLAEDEVVELRGLAVTSALRTTVDLGSRLPLVEAVVALDMALHRRLVTLDALHAYLSACSGRYGIARLRRAAQLAEPAAESPMETRLRLLLVLAGLPRPVAQARLHDSQGRFLGRPDLYYPEQRLALEYDGATHRESVVKDNRRQNLLLSAGFRLLRFSAADVQGSPEAVIVQVRTALAA